MSDAIDWNLWLPPRPLEDTGPKAFKAGQVWAARAGEWSTVRRISDDVTADGGTHRTVELAGAGGAWWFQGSPGAYAAILVQDVGEPEPRDPRVLYTPARADGKPAFCLNGCGAPACGISYGCFSCWPMTHDGAMPVPDRLALVDAWHRIRMQPAPATTQPGALTNVIVDELVDVCDETIANAYALIHLPRETVKAPTRGRDDCDDCGRPVNVINHVGKWCSEHARRHPNPPTCKWDGCSRMELPYGSALCRDHWKRVDDGSRNTVPPAREPRVLPYSPAALRASLDIGGARLDGLRVRGVR